MMISVVHSYIHKPINPTCYSVYAASQFIAKFLLSEAWRQS